MQYLSLYIIFTTSMIILFINFYRTTAISMGSMTARVGSMLSPFILQAQKSIPWFTQVFFYPLTLILFSFVITSFLFNTLN